MIAITPILKWFSPYLGRGKGEVPIMKRTILLLLTVMQTLWLSASSIGTWNCFPAYGEIQSIQPAGKLVYVLSSKGLFSYNMGDGSVQTYHKMNCLSDCFISHIAYCQKAKRLVIVYDNQNIDLLDSNDDVINISDYYNKSLSSDKTINSITTSGEFAYLNTAFGIVRVNVEKGEINNTYSLDKNVHSSCIFNGTIYAATDDGVWCGDMKQNLLDKNNWKKNVDTVFKGIYNIDDHVYGVTDNSIMEYAGNNWTQRETVSHQFLSLSGNKILLGTNNLLRIYDGHMTTLQMQEDTHTAYAYDTANNCFWSNQGNGKLYGFRQSEDGLQNIITDIVPDGPVSNSFAYLRFVNNTLYSCSGGFSSESDQLLPGILQSMTNNDWTIYEKVDLSSVGSYYIDVMCLDVDPKNKEHVFAGGRTGIFEFLNGKFVNYYSNHNSPLRSAIDPENIKYVLVFGMHFDASGNLWILNSQAKGTNVLCLDNSGKWNSIPKDEFWDKDNNGRSLAFMQHAFFDSRGLLWFANNHYLSTSFGSYDIKNDVAQRYASFINQDGTSYRIDYVRTVTEDKDKNIWVGTNTGPFILTADNIRQGITDELYQVKVPRNDGTNFADYLLSGVDVTTIAIDGGNRKWIGTNGQGVYLISADNITQIHHFLANDSKLLSNNIQHIVINDNTGEVFIATDKGLCSYMSDATATNDEMTDDNVYAYPNPVEPDYKGLITVVGLSYNADVKITTSNGVLVAEGRSNGGTFTWDGCDKKGHRVASGVYMVHTATSDGYSGTVCKIAIVN